MPPQEVIDILEANLKAAICEKLGVPTTTNLGHPMAISTFDKRNIRIR